MKKYLLLTPFVLLSCHAHRIGDLTMIATRNIDSKTEYVELRRYVKAKGGTIEEAVDRVLRETPGGEFMKNVVIYSNGAVEGDVWGIPGVKSEKDKKREITENREALERERNRIKDSTARANKIAEREAIEEQKRKTLEDKKASLNPGDKISYTTHTGKVVLGEIVGKDENHAIIKNELGALVKIKYQVIVKL